MRLELTGRHIEITPSIRRLVDKKLEKLDRLLNDSAVSAQAVLSRERHRHRADITVHARGEKFLHGVGDSASWEASLGLAIEKISQQAQRVKGKWQERKRRGAKGEALLGGEAREAFGVKPAPRPRRPAERIRMPRILRASRQALRSMSVGDAARQIESGPDEVVVFRNLESSGIAVLYRRRNGELTLVETEP